jgi:hypothetical protein
VVKNVIPRSGIAGRGVLGNENRGGRKIQFPPLSATSKSAPFAHKSESSWSSWRIFPLPWSALAVRSRWIVLRLLRDASSTVASMLRRKPMSLIQKNATKDSATTAQYSAVRRARIGRLEFSLRLPPNTQIHDACLLVLSVIHYPVSSAIDG